MTASFTFRPARDYRDRLGLFIAFVGDTNSGKTYSALRLGTGIARAQGKRVAVVDTEGGRTLHLRDVFDFDVVMLDAPHRPMRYLEAAQAADAAGYGAVVFDSFSSEWRGIGGVLDWSDERLEAAVARQQAKAARQGWAFNEEHAREKLKSGAMIDPKVTHKRMVSGLLGLRIPIIFAIRGEVTYDPTTKSETFKTWCHQSFMFEVTVSFRLARGRKGVVDLADPNTWKMEDAHREIFHDGDQLSEEHGEKLAAWSMAGRLAGEVAAGAAPATPISKSESAIARARGYIAQIEAFAAMDQVHEWVGGDTRRRMMDWLREHEPEVAKEVEAAEAAAFRRLEVAA